MLLLSPVTTSKPKILIYCILAFVFVAITFGTLALRGKSPIRTYSKVGNTSDITSIDAYQVSNAQLLHCTFSEFRASNGLLLRIEDFFEVYIVRMFINQSVFRKYPNVLASKILVNGSEDFAYALNVWKFNVSTTESNYAEPDFHNRSLADYYNYVDKHYYPTGKVTLYASVPAEQINLANLQIHHWLNQSGLSYPGEYNDSRPSEPPGGFIELRVTDDSGHGIEENRIKRVEITDLTFIREKEGRVPPQPHSPYFLPLTVYFLVILVFLPILLFKTKGKSPILTILVVGFLLRTAIAPLTSHTYDIAGCKRAVRTYYEQGELTLFSTWTSPPTWFFTLLAFHSPYAFLRLLGVPDIRVDYQPILAIEVFFIKLPLILSDVISAYLIYRICKERDLDEKTSRVAAAVYMFNPFSIFISSIWGMFDSLAVLFMLIGFYLFLKNRLFLTSIIWGFGVKWYTLGFIPLLCILSFYRERNKTAKERLLTSILIIIIGFGFFLSIMIIPHILNGDLTYLRQVLSFRLKVGGGGEDRTSLFTFFGPTFWRIFEKAGFIHPFPNLFFYAFGLIYVILLVKFVMHIRNPTFDKTDTFRVFNNVMILTLLIFYLTYPQVTPQCILWVIPLLIFSFFVSRQINVIPLVVTSSLVLPYLDTSYFIRGFATTSNLSFQALAGPFECVFGALILSSTVSFALKIWYPTFYIRISKFGYHLIKRFHRWDRWNAFSSYLGLSLVLFVQVSILELISVLFVRMFLIGTVVLTVSFQTLMMVTTGRGDVLDQELKAPREIDGLCE